ncbi:hypothetical protein [Paraferrimonas haliotis]|uniref:Uncharacterized protein n=1 Tax=Paraferrimonas haliotis TaxID=2013866 RepID=A0AA37TTG9_9GAMM|nr:hypothetical protein [Paraferrimonas haliotis]GLS84117.1 hypothetical protein GCM10007894_20940 [Paraferrimonas haliotis]
MSDVNFELTIWGPNNGEPAIGVPKAAKKADGSEGASQYSYLYQAPIATVKSPTKPVRVLFKFAQSNNGRYQLRWLNSKPGKGGKDWNSGDGRRLRYLKVSPEQAIVSIDPKVYPEKQKPTKSGHILFDVWVLDTYPDERGICHHFRCDPEVIIED